MIQCTPIPCHAFALQAASRAEAHSLFDESRRDDSLTPLYSTEPPKSSSYRRQHRQLHKTPRLLPSFRPTTVQSCSPSSAHLWLSSADLLPLDKVRRIKDTNQSNEADRALLGSTGDRLYRYQPQSLFSPRYDNGLLLDPLTSGVCSVEEAKHLFALCVAALTDSVEPNRWLTFGLPQLLRAPELLRRFPRRRAPWRRRVRARSVISPPYRRPHDRRSTRPFAFVARHRRTSRRSHFEGLLASSTSGELSECPSSAGVHVAGYLEDEREQRRRGFGLDALRTCSSNGGRDRATTTAEEATQRDERNRRTSCA